MDRLRRILVAIRDPRRRSQRGLMKAARLATDAGAHLELFHAISEPLYDDPMFQSPGSLAEREDGILRTHLDRLEKLAKPLRARGLNVSCEASWDFPASHAIVRRSLATRADLIVADSRDSHAGKWLLRFTDWELLRLSSKPVLLVKNVRPYAANPLVLAAVDPGHAADKPRRLDREILSTTALLETTLGARVHALHAYAPAVVGLAPKQMAKEGFVERLQAHTRARAARALDRELLSAGLAKAARHLVDTHPVNAIPATARKLRADIVVMGAISRSGLSRLFFGNTAEDVLDELRSDVLVVKPRSFARRVPAETRGVNLRTVMPPPSYV